MNTEDTLLDIEDLHVSFFTPAGEVKAVTSVTYSMKYGEVLGIVGESGSGKSVSAYSLMGIIAEPGKIVGGTISFNGHEHVEKMTEKEFRKIRGSEISIIFQDPMTSLNPVYTIGNQLIEMLRLHTTKTKKECWDRAVELLHLVGMNEPEKRMKQYPHEFSGGMRQRVMIAIAMTLNPDLLIADEPTTALDVTVQADILDMMKEIQKEHPMSIILITHDLGIVANFATDIIVMYAGKIVERGTAEDIFYHPTHPYTKALLRAVPRLDMEGEKLETIEGAPPNMINPPKGCPFAQRCKERMDICETAFPEESKLSECHEVCCWLQKEGR